MSYLAYKIIKSTYKNDAKADLNNFRTGILMQFLNFKVILYGITVSSNFIIPYYDSHLALFGFSIFLAMMAFASILSWASFGYFFQKFLQKYQKQFNLTMGILLFYSAIKIVI
jgi:threonine/homoserine/homoserine lactone efflux protein